MERWKGDVAPHDSLRLLLAVTTVTNAVHRSLGRFGGAPRQCITSGDIWQYIWMAGRRSTWAVVGRWLSLCTTLLEGVRSASVLPKRLGVFKGAIFCTTCCSAASQHNDWLWPHQFSLVSIRSQVKVKFTFCRLVESVHSQVWPEWTVADNR